MNYQKQIVMVMMSALVPALPAAWSQTFDGPTMRFNPMHGSLSRAAPDSDSRGLITITSRLVIVPVSVTDSKGHTVGGLGAEHFTVFENGVPQTITSFGGEDTPASVGLIFDLSGSMRPSLSLNREAIRAFSELTNPEDEAFLITFADRPTMALPFTSQMSDIQSALFGTAAFGSTALVDAVHLGMKQMRRARNPRRAVLIMSDGGDNHSRLSLQELLRLASEADAQIYSMSVERPVRTLAEASENSAGKVLLQRLAERSGGRHFHVRTEKDVAHAMETFGELLRNQYVIGYKPPDATLPGKWMPLKVQVSAPGGSGQRYHAIARSGYYSPEN